MSHDLECRYPDGFHSCVKHPCIDCPWGLCTGGCGHTREECNCEPDYDDECGEDTSLARRSTEGKMG